MKRIWIPAMLLMAATGCGSVRTILASDADRDSGKPISNPFAFYNPEQQKSQADTMILRSKRGDGAVEVEIPNSGQNISDFVIPVSDRRMKSRGPASVSDSTDAAIPLSPEAQTDSASYKEQKPTLSDREITGTFPQNLTEDDARRRDIEQDLGLVRAEDMTPEKETSYLASIDHVKQLYRTGRYEAALLETDGLVREYPTNPKLYEMRGTLLERVGQSELAIKAWKQALRFDPKNEPLRHFIERKKQRRSLASP